MTRRAPPSYTWVRLVRTGIHDPEAWIVPCTSTFRFRWEENNTVSTEPKVSVSAIVDEDGRPLRPDI